MATVSIEDFVQKYFNYLIYIIRNNSFAPTLAMLYASLSDEK